jgi:hypothetical protein
MQTTVKKFIIGTIYKFKQNPFNDFGGEICEQPDERGFISSNELKYLQTFIVRYCKYQGTREVPSLKTIV